MQFVYGGIFEKIKFVYSGGKEDGEADGERTDEDEEELHAFLRGEITSEKVSESTRSPLSTGMGGEAAPLSDLVVDAKKSALLSKYQ